MQPGKRCEYPRQHSDVREHYGVESEGSDRRELRDREATRGGDGQGQYGLSDRQGVEVR